ncbi:hypothetical protein N1851_002689 [Merluccius polli]|uniref:Uncharacterized protein n=1 Tax=Merluccius polli TaxID=89951 RepID=A0AA47P8F8_MERPO|nr:hypothetical protein N1851_002689 [Merluccius polli]
MDYDEMDEPVLVTANGRKRRCRPLSSSRCKAKINRYSGEGSVATTACRHKSSLCAAVTLTPTSRDSCIRPWIKLRKTQYFFHIWMRHRANGGDLNLRMYRREGRGMFPSSVKKDRVKNFAKYWLEHGKARPENRGGSRENEELLEKRLETTSNHSVAGLVTMPDAPGRKFLPGDLSVSQMHRMFLEQNHRQASYSLYYSIFIYDFNLAFGHPAKDICSTCVKHRIAINNPDSSPEEKRDKIILHTLHRCHARQFYDALNDVVDSFTVCFDIMENLVLPKRTTPGNFIFMCSGWFVTVAEENPRVGRILNLYTWMEFENSKDCNIVASALQHFFSIVAQADLRHFQSLRLFSDSCYGQNKNINLYPQLDITYFFPVRGHSFLSADWVFGRVEQDIRKQPTILLPEEYVSILRKHGTVHQHGKDWECYDFKRESVTFTTSQRSLKISEARVLTNLDLSLCLLQSVLKRGKKWSHFKPAPFPDVNCVKEAKKTDVLKLLGELGVQGSAGELCRTSMTMSCQVLVTRTLNKTLRMNECLECCILFFMHVFISFCLQITANQTARHYYMQQSKLFLPILPPIPSSPHQISVRKTC